MEKALKNAVVGQSGGPTSAINATLCGVISSCLNSGRISQLYGMKNGIEGFLKEDFIDLFSFFDSARALEDLKHTPASALGSCRVRLPHFSKDESVYKKIFSILDSRNIGYFFYIGGNDSMDTVAKLSEYATEINSPIRFVGIPKTIDNDLCGTDHTPGYGSAAKLVTTVTEEILRDCAVYTKNAVTVVEIMGRDSGWITASSALCGSKNGKRVDLIYLPEVPFSTNAFVEDVKKALAHHPDVVVAVSEGIKFPNGEYVCKGNGEDSFGHSMLSGAARVLCDIVKTQIGCKTRAIELNVLQRCSAHILSATDISESVLIGQESVRLALEGETGIMSAIERLDGEYKIKITSKDVKTVANEIKRLPSSFINEKGNGVTKECIDYILPLIQGEACSRFENGMPIHYIFGN